MPWHRENPEYPPLRPPAKPLDKARIWWGLGAMLAIVAVNNWFDPPHPPFQRWAWFDHLAHDAFGPRGPSMLGGALAVACIAAGCWQWARHRSRPPR